ncbi:phage minor capsid protein [Solobacterium sp.]|uniref:phage minor capsid protein n=1 Tax=Solobacterium sp. TaxID=2060878 RepID=UPI001CAF4122|nr:phage minor capsid protein [Solobacterium sp.]MBF1099405.1 phage minor capsid protein [Solobacterium sp.]
MLSEEQIELLGDKYLVGLYQDLEREVLQDIARRVRKTERLTETAEIMAKSMRENGYSAAEIHVEVMKKLNATPEYRRMIAENTYAYKQEVKQKIAETVKTAKEAGDKLIGEAGEMAFNEDLSMWGQGGVDLKQPNSMKQITDGFKAQAKNDLKNITGTTAFKSPLLGTVKTAEAYQRSLDLALLKVSTGTYSYRQACDDVIKEFTRSGLRTVDYASGRTYQVDTAVRMIVRTSTAQLAGKITEANCRTTGQDLVIISQHMGSRDTHAGFQNKVFSMSGKSKKYPDIHAPLGEGCAYGRPEGLQGPNCTHMFYPFWEGISEIPEPLKEPDPVEYKGRSYTRYEATQQMRAMEREIRALKREKYVARTGGEVEHLRAQIRIARADYMSFSEAMNLKPKESRLLVGGERSKWAELKKNVPQLQIKKTKEWLDKSIDKAVAKLEENQNVTRDELTTLFPPKVKIGINPITGKSVYVLDKDMSYFVNKHVRDGSLRTEDLKNIGYVLDYDIAAKEFDKNGNEIGQMFIKKSPYREGYLDAITKIMDDGEEIFHYQFRSNKHAAKLINKKINSQLVIEDRRSVDVKK